MCDTLCALGAAAAGPGAVFAKNSDRPPEEPQPMRLLPPRAEARTRTTYLDIAGAPGDTLAVTGAGPGWMWGLEHGLNEAGVAVGNERVWTDLDPRGQPDALTGMDLVRLGLERGSSAAQALATIVELLEQHGQGGAGHAGGGEPYWSSFLVADHDTAFVLETSGRDWALEEVGRDGRRALSNRLTIPAFDSEHRFDSGGVIESHTDGRLMASQAVLAAGPLDVDVAKAHLRSHVGGTEGHTICMHAGEHVATTASMVAMLDGDGSRGWFLLGAPCRSVYVPLWPGRPLGEVPDWGRFHALTDEHAPALQALEVQLDADAHPGDAWGPEAWQRVDAALVEVGC